MLRITVSDLQECIDKMTSPGVKYDCIIFAEGNRGTGKSTLLYKIACGLKVEKRFNPKRDIVYSRDDVLKHLANKKNGVILADEMINVTYKRDFYQEDQKELLKGFDMYRDSRNVFLGAIPKFTDLDVKMQKLCKLRLTVVRRGVALVQTPLRSIYNTDSWDVRNNQKIESGWALKGIKNPKYGRLTTVRGILRFGDLKPLQRNIYDSIKEEKRGHVFAKYQDEEIMKSPEEIFFTNLIKELKAGSLTPDKFDLMCKINGKKPENIRHQINKRLKADKDEKRFRDYCITEAKRKKLDLLGFEKIAEEKKEELKPISPQKEEKEENIILDESPGEDVLGFTN